MGILKNLFFSEKEEERKEKTVNTIIINEAEYGSSGTEIYSGQYDEEYLEQLKGIDRAKYFDRMRRSSPQIKMLLSAVKNPIRSAPVEITTAIEDDIEAKKHCELAKQVFLKDIDFDKFVKEALTFVDFGHSVFEKVHKVFNNVGIVDDDGNRVIDSYIGFKKLGFRSQKTIDSWNFIDKEFSGITQRAQGDLESDTVISFKHLVIMTLDGEGDDLEGVSMLRPCYGSFFRQNNYFKQNAIGIEKSLPIPSAEIPKGKETSPEVIKMKAMLSRFSNHQQNYLLYPEGWGVKLSNGTSYDPAKIELSIGNEDIRMAKGFLANFLELGQNGGSYALSNDLSDFFLSGLELFSKIIETEVNKLIKEVVILNFGEQERYPTIKFIGIKDKAGEELAKILDLLVKNKVIIPDDSLEKHVRTRYHLPDSSEEGQREVKPEKGQEASFSEQIFKSLK